jgi:hypothetical protein
MKRAFFVFFVLMLIAGTTVVSAWEGTATIAPGGDLPGGGYSIATNSFPVNTTVEVVNLENGKIVRVNVVSGLNTMGLMATLSREAAEAIDLYGNSSCRIRMSQSSHEVSVSQLKLGPVVNPVISAPLLKEDNSAGASPADPASKASTVIASGSADPAGTSVNAYGDTQPENSLSSAAFVYQYSDEVNLAEPEDKAANTLASGVSPAEIEDGDALSSGSSPAKVDDEGYSAFDYITSITLYPSAERLPESSYREISPEYLAPPLGKAEYDPPVDFSPFQVPLISRLERGKYYVQVAAYARPDNVEDEINRIGKSFPLAIQNVGTDSNPLFRVLLGPLDQGESSAMLQRFKNIGYADAFVWRN